MYNPLTGTNTGTYEQYIAQNSYIPRDTYEGTRALRGDIIPWQDQFKPIISQPVGQQVYAPVPWTSMIRPSVPYNYAMPNIMNFLTSPTSLFSNSQWANTPNNNLGVARFGGLLGSPINYTNPNTTTNTQGT
jgi:hypothetical protein